MPSSAAALGCATGPQNTSTTATATRGGGYPNGPSLPGPYSHSQQPPHHQHAHHNPGRRPPSSAGAAAPGTSASGPGVTGQHTPRRPPRPVSAANSPPPGAQSHSTSTRPSLSAPQHVQHGQQAWQGVLNPKMRRLGSVDDGGGGGGGGGGRGGRGGGGDAEGTEGRRSSSSLLPAPALPHSSSVPVGAAFAAVRAAAARSASAQQALSTPPAESGPPSQRHALRAAGSPASHGAGRGGSGGGAAGAAGAGPAHGSPRRAADGDRGAHGSRSDGSGGSGGGGKGRSPGGGAGSRASKAGGQPPTAAGGGSEDVSGLPLEQQVAHYARRGAAAAAAGDAVRAAMAVHLLNGCFLRAAGGGYDGAVQLAAAALAAAPGLVAALVEAVSEGAPQSIVAFNALSYLALAPEAVSRLLSAGLVSVLVGQLRAASSAPLEQQLLVSGLGLLGTMVRVSGEARAKLAAMRGLAAALAATLGHEAAAVRRPALQLVQELIVTRKGLDQVRSSTALLSALDRLCEDPSGPGHNRPQPQRQEEEQPPGQPGEQRQQQQQQQQQQQHQQGQGQGRQQTESLQRQARSIRASIAALATVMK